MKAENKTENGKVIIKQIREHWWEWFKVEVGGFIVYHAGPGGRTPRFYFPVSRSEDRDSFTCWIIPLAPFALLITILWRTFWGIWKDLVYFTDYLRLFNKNKRL